MLMLKETYLTIAYFFIIVKQKCAGVGIDNKKTMSFLCPENKFSEKFTQKFILQASIFSLI